MAKDEILIKLPYVQYENAPSPSGVDEVFDFGYYMEKDDTGKEVEVFGVVGKHSTSEYINSFAENTDLAKLFEKFQAGDLSAAEAMNVRTGEYVDISNVPQSMVEAYNLIMNSQQIYDSLPDEVKAKLADDPMFAGFGGNVKQDVQDTKDEVAELKAQIEELKKGGVKYE